MASIPDHSPDQRNLDGGWFYHRSGGEHGPLARESLAETLRLIPSIEVLVWHPSLPNWVSPGDAQVRALIYGPPPGPKRSPGVLSLLFSFRGRIGRAKFFWSSCFSITPYVVGVIAALAYAHAPITSETGTIIRLALAPPLVWIALALAAKRLHDLDLSALHLLWIAPATTAGAFISPGPASSVTTLVGAIVELALIARRGTPGLNRYGHDPLLATTRDFVVSRNPQRSGWGIITSVVAVILICGTVYAVAELHLPILDTSGQLTCSKPDVAETVKELELHSPRSLLGLIMYGGENNVRLSLRDVRTLSYDQPINGLTCAATLAVSPVDLEKSTVKGEGTSQVTYSVQSTDANDGHFFVSILAD